MPWRLKTSQHLLPLLNCIHESAQCTLPGAKHATQTAYFKVNIPTGWAVVSLN